MQSVKDDLLSPEARKLVEQIKELSKTWHFVPCTFVPVDRKPITTDEEAFAYFNWMVGQWEQWQIERNYWTR